VQISIFEVFLILNLAKTLYGLKFTALLSAAVNLEISACASVEGPIVAVNPLESRSSNPFN